jgi:two-component system, chemotaxis family, CheB/CheR fusion protein
VQIVASDVSSAAIEKARSGKYAEAVAADVNPERLNRHFSKVEGGYRIGKALREMCVFSKHDLIQDRPFSKLDLISCRNVLIFFGRVRKNVIAAFHCALKPDGFLVLGPSETESGNLFSIVAGAQSIYTKSRTRANSIPYTPARPAPVDQWMLTRARRAFRPASWGEAPACEKN